MPVKADGGNHAEAHVTERGAQVLAIFSKEDLRPRPVDARPYRVPGREGRAVLLAVAGRVVFPACRHS